MNNIKTQDKVDLSVQIRLKPRNQKPSNPILQHRLKSAKIGWNNASIRVQALRGPMGLFVWKLFDGKSINKDKLKSNIV